MPMSKWAQWMTPLAGGGRGKEPADPLCGANGDASVCLLVFARPCGKSIEPMVQQCSVLPIVAAHGGCYGYP
jgi:hypothetical protein